MTGYDDALFELTEFFEQIQRKHKLSTEDMRDLAKQIASDYEHELKGIPEK
jgi:uncharacterized protein YfkK (UPF0435 family)